ncbi:AGAP010583-PA [Anopheles gambiae str. PEST]|uniref:AGAP010583-PA n=2 Tax=gambiae species complex TaxID=44542 RepID=A0NE05_ANOGA|nr:AGAP010583-PA [Anopheles gambiae str. PEST]
MTVGTTMFCVERVVTHFTRTPTRRNFIRGGVDQGSTDRIRILHVAMYIARPRDCAYLTTPRAPLIVV